MDIDQDDYAEIEPEPDPEAGATVAEIDAWYERAENYRREQRELAGAVEREQ